MAYDIDELRHRHEGDSRTKVVPVAQRVKAKSDTRKAAGASFDVSKLSWVGLTPPTVAGDKPLAGACATTGAAQVSDPLLRDLIEEDDTSLSGESCLSGFAPTLSPADAQRMSDAVLEASKSDDYLCSILADPVLSEFQGEPHKRSVIVKKERARHRIVAYGLAMGDSYEEIALRTGYTYQHVCNLNGQPWMAKIILHMQNTLGFNAINMALRELVMPSIRVLADQMNDTSIPAGLKAKNAQYLIDRVMGKAAQPITMSNKGEGKDPIDEIQKIDAALAAADKPFPEEPNLNVDVPVFESPDDDLA